MVTGIGRRTSPRGVAGDAGELWFAEAGTIE